MAWNVEEHRRARSSDRSFDRTGLIAGAATAVAGAALYYLINNTRSGREARARLADGDVGRRLRETMEEIQRLAEQGAAYVERRAAELRQALEARPSLME
jgi:hypothetical protein